MKATHQVKVIPIARTPHPNADSLFICKVDEVFNVVMRTEDWIGHDKAVYIPPQNIVNTNLPEFSFLKRDGSDEEVVKPIKLRGVHSYGLCVPCPDGFNIGDDLTEYFGIKHYEPELQEIQGQEQENGGKLGSTPKYDIDSVAKYLQYWNEEDVVICQEKIHGQNFRAYFDGETLHVGGRNCWFRSCDNLYWKAVRRYPQIETLCRAIPNHILYGEQYGHVKGYHYGKTKTSVGFAAFDIRTPDLQFLPQREFLRHMQDFGIPTPTTLYVGKFDSYEFLERFSFGQTTYMDSHIREGCVVKLFNQEESYPTGDRKVFKIINPEY
jgi:RNA ligase (TIGR02306 family)